VADSAERSTPGPFGPGFFIRQLAQASELVVQTRPYDVFVKLHVRAASGAGELAEIDIEILGLDRPIRREGVFRAAAHGPAGARVVLGGEAGDIRFHVAKGGAGRHIGHETVDRVAEAPTHGAEPIALRFADAGDAGSTTLDALPIEIAFDAEHRLAELIIVAEGAADEAAIHVETV
jgi:hypothetical protein